LPLLLASCSFFSLITSSCPSTYNCSASLLLLPRSRIELPSHCSLKSPLLNGTHESPSLSARALPLPQVISIRCKPRISLSLARARVLNFFARSRALLLGLQQEQTNCAQFHPLFARAFHSFIKLGLSLSLYIYTSVNPVPNAQVCYFNNVLFMF
jgi:hypothetical protein